MNRVILSATELKVTKPGFDVLTTPSTQPDAFSLDSTQQNFGVWFTGTAVLAKANASGSGGTTIDPVWTTITFPYALDHIPLIMMQWVYMPVGYNGSSANVSRVGANKGLFYEARKDKVAFGSNDTQFTVMVRYVVFQNKWSAA